ncbi:uncharacterized protein LOC117113443 isoform X1 [Anneissia japonica]|uniref:uncharacterized protein LOC117113443 isoform X1 n=1 Tax=Anneissia japonica TaxID=1529436 RepID=UPI001425A4B2|nr:uncharacterized protein LOC117113443 isoform X1 [Anneissia japonica]
MLATSTSTKPTERCIGESRPAFSDVITQHLYSWVHWLSVLQRVKIIDLCSTMSHEKLESLKKLRINALKEMCRDANLKVSGTKGQLLMRLCGLEKEKTTTRLSVKGVNKWLEKQGVENIDTVSNCLRAGIQKGYIDISGETPLDNIVIEDMCYLCEHDVKVTIRDLLYQQDYAGMDYEEGGEEATVKCPNDDCELVGMYVTGMCCGSVNIDSGKGHNHCTVCPRFGKCIGDYREEHCNSCGKHFFAGSGGQFKCPCRGPGSDNDSYDGAFFFF